MFYKPNYCCSCGDKIERIEWRLWTNRRFCQLCETEHQLDDWLKRIVPVMFLICGLFGIGSYFKQSARPVDLTESGKTVVLPKAGRIESVKPPTAKEENAKSIQTKDEKSARQAETKTQTESLKQDVSAGEETRPAENVKRPQKSAKEAVYFCGAETKKGTPCSRRVKGGGRCWQHIGRDAILSEADLLIESN